MSKVPNKLSPRNSVIFWPLRLIPKIFQIIIDKFVNLMDYHNHYGRNAYPIKLRLNHRQINRVIIDQHYKRKHPDVTDLIIINLVQALDEEEFLIEEIRGKFQYFVVEPIFFKGAPYRLVLVLCIFDDYLGVINAFRVKRGRYEQN